MTGIMSIIELVSFCGSNIELTYDHVIPYNRGECGRSSCGWYKSEKILKNDVMNLVVPFYIPLSTICAVDL